MMEFSEIIEVVPTNATRSTISSIIRVRDSSVTNPQPSPSKLQAQLLMILCQIILC